ncbi:phosphorylcholine transferase LicD [Anaerovibrio lipolyticus]|uniref:LicD family protein n=1 Tax=Anaerovibrio lipolyticus TaxID=82374 RepID=UPI0026EFDDE6|nr:LicD family protein [Anaerovibrio lipolyticus]MBE6105129.1 LicD family protein [Anaerovibrio lipolyticus]
MAYIRNIDTDEIRDGFLVTSNRKKVWNKLMEILVEIDRICQKNSIKYFAEGGTLIGAARHRGFIPWDDDIDITMLRPDYEKFKLVAPQELAAPFALLTAYNSDSIFTIGKLMNLETAAIEYMEATHHQGIFIDIWPFDDVPDGSQRCGEVWDIRQSLIGAIMNPNGLLHEMEKGLQYKPSNDFIKSFILLSPRDRFREYEKFCANHFGESENVGYPFSKIMGIKGNLKADYYRDVTYLPFEGIKVPVSAEYEKVLEAEFGDWHKFVRSRSFHEVQYMSADISYTEIQSKINHALKKAEH